MAMTQEEYVTKGGTVCPFCGGENLEWHHIESTGGGAFQECWCLECEKEWYDVYGLKGYEEVTR